MQNEFYTTIIALASFFTAATVIVGTLHKCTKLTKRLREWLNLPVKESIDEINTRLNELSDQILKITICSEEIPIEERLCAGEIYVNKRNLNGEIKAKYKVLKENYESKLKKDR